jgi:hypothetical protein
MNYLYVKSCSALVLQGAYLSHVSWGIRVFGPEYRSHAVDSLHPASNLKLLVELRRLGQECRRIKVWQLEHICSSFRCSTDQGRRVEVEEIMFLEVFAEEAFDSNANFGNGIRDRGALVHSYITEMCCQTGDWRSFCYA